MSLRKKRHRRLSSTARAGKIVTFYSYKGGTGRSLAIANVAWILADSGKKVLVIDWDLEAPGLHRYFHPFIDDKNLANTPGLIDFLIAFVEGSRIEKMPREPAGLAPSGGNWFDRYVSFFPYAFTLRGYKFRSNGTLNLMPAGRQDGGYAVKVTHFDWEEFYDRLGGGVFLQAFKGLLREHYDYVLIDSRTGISDTSGICTVQMPDDLVVCFTYNSQSIFGAEAAARSALAQRLRPSGEPGLRVWPVPTRVDPSEQVRLDAARVLARQTFQHFLIHLPRNERQRYWHGIEVPYAPYLAFEEVLAPFVDRSRSKLSILDSMFALVSAITDGAVKTAPPVPESVRREILSKFERAASSISIAPRERGTFYLSHAMEDRSSVESLGRMLNSRLGEGSVVWDTQLLRPGDKWPEILRGALGKAQAVLILITENWLAKDQTSHSKQEAMRALKLKKQVVPMLLGVQFGVLSGLPGPLKSIGSHQGFLLSAHRESWDRDLAVVAAQLNQIRDTTVSAIEVDVDDPQKGQWGGKAEADGRRIDARVRETADEDWFQIELEVVGTDQRPLTGAVDFYLHPTFVPARRRVQVDGNRASLSLGAYGAFTVGAEADGGETRLELDLAKLRSAPRAFRIH